MLLAVDCSCKWLADLHFSNLFKFQDVSRSFGAMLWFAQIFVRSTAWRCMVQSLCHLWRFFGRSSRSLPW